MVCRVSARSVTSLILAAALILGIPQGAISQTAQKIAQIAVSGNQNINTETIMNSISLKAGDDYTEQAVEKDRASIMALGYFSVVTVHKEDVSGGVNITYEVTENPKIADIKIVGSQPVTPEKILGLMKTKSNQVLNTATLNQDIEAIQSYYVEQGYIAYVTEDIAVDPQTGVLTVPILVHIVQSVEITGNKKTKEYVFLREMKTEPGNVFNVKTLKDDIVKIYNLDILDDIKPYQITPGNEIGKVRITIPVVEKKTGNIALGFGYSSKQRLVGQARLSETNFRGKGQGLNVLYEQGTTEAVGGPSSYEFGFSEPWIDKNHTSLSVNAFNRIQYRFSSGIFNSGTGNNDDFYNERRKGADLTLGRPLNDVTRVYLRGRFENVETDPDLLTTRSDLLRIAQTGDVAGGSMQFVHNNRDIDLDPAAGGYESVSLELGTCDTTRYKVVDGVDDAAQTIASSPLEGAFQKTSIDLRRYFSRGGRKTSPQDKRTTIAMRLRGGFATGKVPFYEQYFVGGSESLRGYREDRFWGDKMLVASVELRKPIAQSISGVLFADYGGAWGGDNWYQVDELPQSSNFQGHLGVGVGMRVTTPIGHLRLDYGVGSEGGRTHFSMGQAF